MVPRLAARLGGRWLAALPGPLPLPPPFENSPFERLAPSGRQLGSIWLQTTLPATLASLPVDLFLAPINVLPAIGRSPSIVVVHDLTALTRPEAHSLRVVLSQLPFWGTTLRRASVVVVPSTATGMELALLDPGIARKVLVIPNGVDERFFAPVDPESTRNILDRLAIAGPFVLSVGTLEPRKDLLSLVEAMEALWAEGVTSVPLVLAGRVGWKSGPILHRIATSPFSERILLPGHVADEELPPLLSAATLFVFPSIDEGFGLPPLEAMAAGVPVIARQIPVMLEVCGDGAELAPGRGAGPLAAAIRPLLASAELRRELGARGRERARRFRWESAAEGLAAAARLLIRTNRHGVNP
jgi:glycosyltransferase involved in cell wall biosynthesis